MMRREGRGKRWKGQGKHSCGVVMNSVESGVRTVYATVTGCADSGTGLNTLQRTAHTSVPREQEALRRDLSTIFRVRPRPVLLVLSDGALPGPDSLAILGRFLHHG
eukprot:764786-Hanusia_phi.AAC.1